VSGYSSQLQIGGTVTRADIRGNTIRNPGQGIVASFVTSTVGGTYSNTSGAVSLITAATHNIPVGGTFTTANMFGTGGGNFLGLNGTQIATAGTTGTTLNYTAAPGLGTINIGTSHASAGRISTVTYAVASHIVAGTYTSDSSGNISLTTDVPHGFVSGNRFVLGSVLGPTVPLGGEFTATTGTAGTTLNFVTAPSTSFVVTSGRVMPANYGITVEGSDFCRVTGNRVGDYQKPTLLTAAIGGAWGDSGISEGNYFGPRSAVDPDVSFYGSGSQGSSYDAMFGFAVANSSIAGLVTFEGATQQSGGMPAYLPPQGLTPGWNRSRGQGEVNFYLGRGAGAPGGFNFLQVAVIHITSGSYTAATGIVSVTTSLPHGVIPGGAFVIRSATGTDSNDGDDIAHLNGGHIANSDTTGSTLTFTIRLNLTISSITGGTVVPSGAGGGLIDITAGSGGMLFSVDGHGNATIPGTLSVGGAVTGGGGSYLPLSGGIHSIAESGAVGDGTTDDQPAIQAWLNTLTAGAEVLLQPGKWYYIHAATLTIPPHITVRGAYSSKDSQIVAGSAAFLAAGGFFIDPALPAGIIMAGPSSLRQVKVYRAGLVGGVSNAQATTDYATWAAEGVYQPTNGAMTGGATVIPLASTTGITVGMQVTGLGNLGPLQGAAWTPSKVIAINPGVSVTISAGVATAIASGTWFRFGQSIGIVISRASAGVTIDDCVIIGFRTGIQTFPGQFGITRTIGDSITNVECVGGGDFAVIRDCEFMPLYGNPPNTNYSRAGDGIFYHDCAGPSFFNCYVIGWKISWHIENSAFWGQFCGGEVVTDGGPGLVNWYIRGGGAARLYDCNAQAGGIGYHIDGANDLYMSDCTSSGSQVTTANNTAHFLVENALAVGNMFLTINCPSTLGGYPSKVPLKMGAGTVNAFSFNNPTIFDLAATPTVPFVQGNLPPTFTPKFSSGIVYRGSRTTGGTTPIVQYWNGIIFDGAGTLATHTITLPPYPMDGQNVDIFFNIGITALTYATTDGALIGAYNNPNAGERVRLAYSAAQNTWFVGGRGVPGTIKYTRLFTSLSVIGNGADLTEDTLVSYTIPANTLVNVGDALRIVASGAFIGSTDAKTARIRIGGITSGTPTTTAATSTTWRVELNVTRAALNTQEYEYFGAISGAAGTQLYNNAQSSLGDASPATLTVTGQNTTNSVASSVTVRTVTVDLIRA
jgi:hypothetical protein